MSSASEEGRRRAAAAVGVVRWVREGVGEILRKAANVLQNKLTRAQYLDEVTWTTKSWLGLQKQRISVVLHTAIAEQIVNELACGEGGQVHGASVPRRPRRNRFSRSVRRNLHVALSPDPLCVAVATACACSWRTSETSVSTFCGSRSPFCSSCRTALLCAGTELRASRPT